MTVGPASSLALADVLTAVGLELADVLLIRHPLSNQGVRVAVEANQLREYTSDQLETFPAHHRYWVVFLGEESTSARFVACFLNDGRGSDGFFELAETSMGSAARIGDN